MPRGDFTDLMGRAPGIAGHTHLSRGKRPATHIAGRFAFRDAPRPLPERYTMATQLGDEAPDFVADTTEGPIAFHTWKAGHWAVLFSHPRDFTPVCTTELGALARLKPEFDQRGVRVIGLSVDPLDAHARWANDIADVTGHRPNYPLI